jgi:3-oxoacyl-[acyl-carrier-protein] synthase II
MKGYENKSLGLFISGPSTDLSVGESFYKSFIEKEDLTKFKYDLANASLSCLAEHLGEEFSINGPRKTIMSACTSASHSIGLAYDLIRTGKINACIAGGSETVSKLTFTGFHALKSVDFKPCRPFDKDREGLSFGEGAGFLLLEEKESALNRGAEILAEIVGYGSANEGYHDITPHPEGLGYSWAMERCLKNSGVAPEKIGYINAHGTGTTHNDVAESLGINRVFSHGPKVSSIKGLIGHCMGASGALESVACILALKNQFIPGNKNLLNLDPEIQLNVPTDSVDCNLEYVMNNNSGFGGTFTSLLFKRGNL